MAETRDQDLGRTTQASERVFKGTLFDFMERVSFKYPEVEEVVSSVVTDRGIGLQDFVVFCRTVGQELQQRGLFVSAAECFELGFFQQQADTPEDKAAIQELAKSYIMAMASHVLSVHQRPLPPREKLGNLLWFDRKINTCMQILEAVDREDQEAQVSARNMFMALYFMSRGRTVFLEEEKQGESGE